MAGVEILEGFLCPICVQDLGSVVNLQDHFEIAHSAEDRALLNQLKGLFGKAKRKFLGQESETGSDLTGVENLSLADPSAVLSSSFVGGIDPSLWEPQEIGVARNLTDYFKSVRGSNIDRYVIETNKLLIRLDKLINTDVPMDPGKRKAFEKTVVSWAPDSDVSLCTQCGRSFSLTRRRHHCRLCGRILCNKCSHFLSSDFAKKLTNPAFSFEGEGFRRSGSNSSLNSIFTSDGDLHIRTCNECRLLLERRDEQMSRRVIRPVLVLLYERFSVAIQRGNASRVLDTCNSNADIRNLDRSHDYMCEAESLVSEYIEMANSLNLGETTFNLEDAQTLRLKLTKLYENIAAMSKRISVLGLDNPEPPTPKALRLQQMIAARASAFIQETLLGLPTLPTEAELLRLREAKRLEAQRRIAEERRLEREQQRRREEAESHTQKEADGRVKTTLPFKAGVKFSNAVDAGVEVVTDSGWKPAEVTASAGRHNVGEDPMVQQMNIIRGYIKQARDARRWDEVQMLEDNLKELQKEYWVQHNTSQ